MRDQKNIATIKIPAICAILNMSKDGSFLNERSKEHRSNKDSCYMCYTEYVKRRKLLNERSKRHSSKEDL